jgi:hypothetical protein
MSSKLVILKRLQACTLGTLHSFVKHRKRAIDCWGNAKKMTTNASACSHPLFPFRTIKHRIQIDGDGRKKSGFAFCNVETMAFL